MEEKISKVIIFKEFARELIFDASTEEAIKEASLNVFIRRWSNPKSYYFRAPEEIEFTSRELEYMNIAEDILSSLPTEVADKMRNERDSLLMRKKVKAKEVEAYNNWFKEAQILVNLEVKEAQLERKITLNKGTDYEKTLPSVVWLLEHRNSLTGEGFKIITLESL